MTNLNSSQIRVFPTTTRTTTDPQARLMTEYNLTSLINKLVDKEAFVITTNLQDVLFSFNIQGYIFSVQAQNTSYPGILELIDNTVEYAKGYTLRASISINRDIGTEDVITGVPLKTWAQLKGNDTENGLYTGVSFEWIESTSTSTSTVSGTDYSYSLDILRCESVDGTFPEGESDEFTTEDNLVSLSGKFIRLPDKKNLLFAICPSSKIKFETNKEGTNRSVRIDDGELN